MTHARASDARPLRIALVTPILPVPHDATRGRYIHETARALGQLANVRTFFAQPRYPALPGIAPRSFLGGHVEAGYTLPGLDLDAFTYAALPGLSRLSNGLAICRALLPRLRAFEPDLVLAYWLYPDGYGAQRAARTLGLPCVLGARGSDIHVRSPFNAWMTRRAIRRADTLLTVSEAMRRHAVTHYGADAERTHTIVNGFDTDVFRPRSQAALRAQLGLAADARVIAYVGRLVETKGLVELLDAFAALRKTNPRLHLALVGDGVMRAQLVAMIEEKGLGGCVSMPGAVEPPGVADWIGASDVLTLPSWSEGYPNVVVEAIACGRPVVATDVGGTREIVDAGNGLLVPPRDSAALAEALARALARDWDATRIAAAITRSWHDVAKDTLAVCRRVGNAGRR